MLELADDSVQLMVTSPPYPMIKMWDIIFARADPKNCGAVARTGRADGEDEDGERRSTMRCTFISERFGGKLTGFLWTVALHAINIGDATRTVNGKFELFPNHARIMEICEKIGFTTLPYILWKKPTTKPTYKGKGAFLGSGFLPPNAYVTLDCEFILLFRKGNLRKFPPHDQTAVRQHVHEASAR